MSIPKKAIFPAALLLLAAPFLLAAQEQSPGEIPVEPDWIEEDLGLYVRGDKIFSMSLGVLFPTLFLNERGGGYTGNINLGGTGSLGFFYFFTGHWFLGGEVQGMFASTLGENMLYIIPIGVRGGYQFYLGPFEFPLSLMIGMAPMTHLATNYLGLFLKPEVSAFWRFNSSWSFGVNTGWWFVPQWPKGQPARDRYANFLELTLSARYHF
ncbi:MAG: hypothetical protein LBQ35_02035 [Spirochaetaceae bacterium]|jgi:hypothetical protein|nr:hypothetical protein [Spirochaetaceae bacterium]